MDKWDKRGHDPFSSRKSGGGICYGFMPRIAIAVISAIVHRVTQRGHRREDFLFEEADGQRHIQLTLRHIADTGQGIWLIA
jgi:hypothetical protein